MKIKHPEKIYIIIDFTIKNMKKNMFRIKSNTKKRKKLINKILNSKQNIQKRFKNLRPWKIQEKINQLIKNQILMKAKKLENNK